MLEKTRHVLYLQFRADSFKLHCKFSVTNNLLINKYYFKIENFTLPDQLAKCGLRSNSCTES